MFPLRRGACATLLVVLSLAAACRAKTDDRETPARDRAQLDELVAADGRVDRALKEADDASRDGDDARAAALLETTATALADRAVDAARAIRVESTWAMARRDELAALARDRRAEIPRYAAALRGDDLDAKLRAVETQVALQRRAVTLATAVLTGPTPASSVASGAASASGAR